MAVPEEIKKHSHKYKDNSWEIYTYDELCQWVKLLLIRAGNRTDINKSKKDIDDANNYLAMLKAKFEVDADKVIQKYYEKRD